MPIFKINQNKLETISEKKIDLERDIQKLTEENLEAVFGYKFIASELKVDNFRFDTLAWNPETKSFVIIEYKKDKNFSVVDQGFSYLSLLVNKREFFLYEYFEHTKHNLSRSEVDWAQSRVVFVSPYFTSHQINSVNFRNMAFDLYEVKLFDNNTILYDQVKPSESSESIETVMASPAVQTVSREIKNITVEDVFKPSWQKSRGLFDVLDEKILALNPNIKRNIVKSYVGYKIDQKNILLLKGFQAGPSIEFMRSQPKDFKDPESKVEYTQNSLKYYNQHTSWFWVKNFDDVDYAMMLIKQAYERFKKNFAV